MRLHRRARRQRLDRRPAAHQLMQDPLRAPARVRRGAARTRSASSALDARCGLDTRPTATGPPAPPTRRRDSAPPARAPTAARHARPRRRPRSPARRPAPQSLPCTAARRPTTPPTPIPASRARKRKAPITASGVKHRPDTPTVKHVPRQDKRVRSVRCEATFLTHSRRPSAAAGCGRLAALAVLGGQHRDREGGTLNSRRHQRAGPLRQLRRSRQSRGPLRGELTLGPDGLALTAAPGSADGPVKEAGQVPPTEGRPHQTPPPGSNSRRYTETARAACNSAQSSRFRSTARLDDVTGSIPVGASRGLAGFVSRG